MKESCECDFKKRRRECEAVKRNAKTVWVKPEASEFRVAVKRHIKRHNVVFINEKEF